VQQTLRLDTVVGRHIGVLTAPASLGLASDIAPIHRGGQTIILHMILESLSAQLARGFCLEDLLTKPARGSAPESLLAHLSCDVSDVALSCGAERRLRIGPGALSPTARRGLLLPGGGVRGQVNTTAGYAGGDA